MNKENKITVNNLVYALLFLVLGIILLTSTEDLITIVSKIIGYGLIIVGIVKSINYVYLKGKLGDYSISNLSIGLIIICFGILLVLFSSALSFAIRTIVGLWIVFAGINRIIFAISMKSLCFFNKSIISECQESAISFLSNSIPLTLIFTL